MHVCMLSPSSHVGLLETQRAVALQVSLSMGLSRQEYWSGLPCPSPGDLPNPGIEPASLYLISPALAGRPFTNSTTWEAQVKYTSTKTKTLFEENSYYVKSNNNPNV